MDDIPWLAPLESVSILGAVVAAWICIRNLAPWQRMGGIAFAISMGLGTIVVMSNPVELAPGVRFDFRTSLLAAAALISGPVSIIAGAMAAGYRIYLGGAGAIGGVVAIVAAVFLGIAFHLRARASTPSNTAILLLSVAVAFSGILVSPIVPTDLLTRATGAQVALLILLKIVTAAACSILLRQDSINGRIARENLTYRRIFEALPDGLSVKDAGGRFVIANPAMVKLMGAGSAERLSGKTDFDFYPAAMANAFRQHELDVTAARKPTTLEQSVISPSGAERQLDTLKVPLFDPDGEFIGLITHNRDVTETNSLKRDLAYTQAKLKDAIDNMTDGLSMFDKNGLLVYCNERCRALFPLSAHVLVPGTHISEVIGNSLAEREYATDAFDFSKLLTGKAADAAMPAEMHIRRFDGRWLSMRAAVVDEGLLFIVADITEARRAQAELEKQMSEYHALFDNSLAGIYRSSIGGRMLKANAALVRLNGFDSEAELVEGVRDIATEWYVDPTRRKDFQNLMTRDGRVTDFVSEVYRYKSRERIWVSETAWNVIGADGKPAYYEGTMIEITDRMRAEDEIKKANIKLLSLAATDGLTGLMNRRSFDEVLERELASTASRGEPLSLILADVDHFKAYNDRYGHQAGDDCLRFLAQVLKTACRAPSDIACRYGGEEMAIILPGTSARHALAIANRLAESVHGLNLLHEASPKGLVTISIGVSTASRTLRSPGALIGSADEALYTAKAKGRDRVEAYAPAEKRARAKAAR
ncbi:diguanylate cyclase [Rhizobium sp.]